MKQESEILPLTGLRFIAALYVFLFHMQIRWPITNIPVLKNILDQGAIGMSVFFVLSGFLLAYRYVGSDSTIKDYLINRFARIYPIYVLAALTTLPWMGIKFGADGAWLELGKFLFLLVSNLFLVQAWFPQLFAYWNDSGSWSIAVEAFCYAVLPFVLPGMSRLSLKQLGAVALSLWLLSVMPGVSIVLFSAPPFSVFYAMPIFRLPEFLLGVCALLAMRHGFSVRFSPLLTVVLPLVLFVYIGFYGAVMPMYIGNNWIVLPVICLMIVALSTGGGAVAWLLSRRFFVWLGKISYCFYSLQALLLFALTSNHDRLVSAWPIFLSGKVLMMTTLFVLIVISAAGYYLVEEPSRRWIKAWHRRSTLKQKGENVPSPVS
jgi:peptidoglycan/LPS O-acetylase OafA/YrhL